MSYMGSHMSAITVGALAKGNGTALVGRTYPGYDDQRPALKDMPCTQVHFNNVLRYRSFYIRMLLL